MKFFQYLSYVLRHKWYVLIECWKRGLFWRGIAHDMSKFRPSEFIPYMEHFYGRKKQVWRDSTGYYKPTDTGDRDFDYAWFLHQKRNDHHWQWWVLPEDEAGVVLLPMSESARLEMVCDWIGAGKARGCSSPSYDRYRETRKWYTANSSKLQLHESTRAWVEKILGVRGAECSK
jgi:hypothetical protein